MSDYKQQAARMRRLGRAPVDSQEHSPSLTLPSRSTSQAEYHRPTGQVQAFVQRHFFPAEGAVSEGVGEPVYETNDRLQNDSARVSQYQQLVRRRAAETSRAIKAQEDAKIKLASEARDRLLARRAYSLEVAARNATAAPHNSRKGKSDAELNSLEEPPTLPSPEGSHSPDPVLDEVKAQEPVSKHFEVAGAKQPEVVEPAAERRRVPEAPLLAQPAREATPSGKPTQDVLRETAKGPQIPAHALQQPARQTLVSVAARRRLALYSDAATGVGETAGVEQLQPLPTPIIPSAVQGASKQAKVLKTRVLHPSNTVPSPTGAKMFKGKLLPLSVSAADETGLARIAHKVSEVLRKADLPRLCACPNNTNVFNPSYVQNCARNCPLYMRPDRYETLLTAWLRGHDVI